MKCRVLFLEHSTDGTIGGSHLCLLEICRHIDRQQYQPVVCFFEENGLIREFELVGAEVHVLRLPANWIVPSRIPKIVARPLGFAANLLRTIVIRARLWIKLLERMSIDVVHINNACSYDHDLMLAARLTGRTCVVHERGIQRSIDRRTRFFANRVDRIIAISDAVANNLTDQGIDAAKIVRIDDGIDESRFREGESKDSVRRRFGLEAGAPVIGIVGNIKQWKGQHVVVDAVGLLIRTVPRLRCLLVGSVADEKYYNDLLVRANALGIPNGALVFTGYEPRPSDLMRAMDVVIHASTEPEPFGIVLLEAMGAGRPLIATDIGGPKEIVKHAETGFLVPPGDAEALRDAVLALLDDADKAARMGELGRRRYFEHYTAGKMVSALEHQYRLLIKAGEK